MFIKAGYRRDSKYKYDFDRYIYIYIYVYTLGNIVIGVFSELTYQKTLERL